MILTAGAWDNTIRWIPPLNVTADQMNDALNIFESSLSAVIKLDDQNLFYLKTRRR